MQVLAALPPASQVRRHSPPWCASRKILGALLPPSSAPPPTSSVIRTPGPIRLTSASTGRSGSLPHQSTGHSRFMASTKVNSQFLFVSASTKVSSIHGYRCCIDPLHFICLSRLVADSMPGIVTSFAFIILV
jgi:hypothetical protein